MKKKPSLLDIELFVQKRTDEKQKELSQLEARSDALVFESIASQADQHADSIAPSLLEQNPSESAESISTEKGMEKPVIDTEKKDTQYRQVEFVDERLTSIIEITDSQRDEINKLKQDMFKLKEQLRVYHSFLGNQQKKILYLEKMLSDKEQQEEFVNKGVVDENYSKLLLKNIVWLKEEKDFSSNDVARLFRAEGFDTPHPYQNWDEKVINTMYADAKRSFL